MKFLLYFAVGVVAALAGESPALQDLINGNLKFTADVYSELKKSSSDNFLVCPTSVDVVLALAEAGAGGKTAQQLISGLHLPDSNEKIHEAFTALTPSLNVNDKYTLNSANKIYVKEHFQISDHYKNVAVTAFNSEIQNIDFGKSAQAATEINKWVEGRTHDNIKDLVKTSDVNEDTIAILINAIYFHGDWVTPFSAGSTKKSAFYSDNKNHAEVDMMENTKSFNYYESSELNAKFLELRYKGDDITMTFVLPNDVEGLHALEEKIADVLDAPQYSSHAVHVQIPKFKVESTIQFKPILQNLGIVDAFEDSADFTGIGANKEFMKISKVVQKAFIQVDEKGTTAAAATAVYFMRTAIIGEPKQFVADHPFIYFLKSPQGILFIGRYIHHE